MLPLVTTIDQNRITGICVIAWGLMGDVFLRVPLIEALRSRFPAADIVAIVDPPAVKVVANHPACTQVIAVTRKKKPLKSYLASIRTGLDLRRRGFDVSLDSYAGRSSMVATLLINARWRIGFDDRRGLRAVNNVLVSRPSHCQHWSRDLGALLEPLGIGTETIRCGTSYFCRDSSRAAAKRLLAGFAHEKFVAFNLGAGDVDKCWPVSRFVTLAQALQKDHGIVPVVLRNPGQENLADQFAGTFSGPLVSLPRLEFDIEAAVLEQCWAMVTGDSGLMHLAIGLKRPVLALFTGTRPEAVAPQDCIFVPCMREDARSLDAYGRPSVNPDLPVDTVLAGFQELEQRISRAAQKGESLA